jgi:hypothetical protein
MTVVRFDEKHPDALIIELVQSWAGPSQSSRARTRVPEAMAATLRVLEAMDLGIVWARPSGR